MIQCSPKKYNSVILENGGVDMVNFLSRHKISCILVIIIAIIGIAAAVIFTSPMSVKVGTNWAKFECDFKLIRLNTDIIVYKDNEKIGSVKGNVLRIITDPLTYYDVNNNKIAYADDTYHLIAQDSHAIVVDGKVSAEMVGKVRLIGNAYDIYDSTGHLIATAEFDFLNLNGKITDINGTDIVAYRANPILQDFSFYISPDSMLDETTILMICASYYSDHSADTRNSNSSSD